MSHQVFFPLCFSYSNSNFLFLGYNLGGIGEDWKKNGTQLFFTFIYQFYSVEIESNRYYWRWTNK
jgi:hypothetical protein